MRILTKYVIPYQACSKTVPLLPPHPGFPYVYHDKIIFGCSQRQSSSINFTRQQQFQEHSFLIFIFVHETKPTLPRESSSSSISLGQWHKTDAAQT